MYFSVIKLQSGSFQSANQFTVRIIGKICKNTFYAIDDVPIGNKTEAV